MRCEKTAFWGHLYIKCIILPRQARDKHRENSKTMPFSQDLFPDEYIHLGGDEVTLSDWTDDKKIAAYLKQQHPGLSLNKAAEAEAYGEITAVAFCCTRGCIVCVPSLSWQAKCTRMTYEKASNSSAAVCVFFLRDVYEQGAANRCKARPQANPLGGRL
jgi:hypothetical protein